MSPVDAITLVVTNALPGWRVQFGAWTDGAKTDQYAVIRPAGGMPVSVVREPQFTVTLIGALNSDRLAVYQCAQDVITAMGQDNPATDPVFLQPGEPAYSATTDGRPVYEMAVSTITDTD